MGQLTVRNVDDEVLQALKVQAARHGRSAEAEVRDILRRVLMPSTMSIEDYLSNMPDVGADEDFERIEGL